MKVSYMEHSTACSLDNSLQNSMHCKQGRKSSWTYEVFSFKVHMVWHQFIPVRMPDRIGEVPPFSSVHSVKFTNSSGPDYKAYAPLFSLRVTWGAKRSRLTRGAGVGGSADTGLESSLLILVVWKWSLGVLNGHQDRIRDPKKPL